MAVKIIPCLQQFSFKSRKNTAIILFNVFFFIMTFGNVLCYNVSDLRYCCYDSCFLIQLEQMTGKQKIILIYVHARLKPVVQEEIK